MPKYRYGAVRVYRRGKTWWIDYYHDGNRVRESADTCDKSEARRLLQERMGQIAEGRYGGPRADRVTLVDLARGLLDDYKTNGRKTLSDVKIRINLNLFPFFGKRRRAQSLTSTDVRSYISERQVTGS